MVYKSTGGKLYKACSVNLKSLGTECEMFSADHEGRYPQALKQLVPDYLRSLPACFTAGRDTYSSSYRSTEKPEDTYTIYCKGSNHASDGLSPDHPR